MMTSLFLIGGGWDPEGFQSTFGRFIKAATINNIRRVLLIIAYENEDEKIETQKKYYDAFNILGVLDNEIVPVFMSEGEYLSESLIRAVEPTGIFVCGGLTPLYYQCICKDTKWLDYLISHDIPYGGFSAGSAIIAEKAIVGGWKILINEKEVPILDSDLAEDIEFLDVRNGLGLTSFSIDVHGSQWGTLSRLIHAIDQNIVETGWAVDEGTMLQIENENLKVYGLGQAYYVRKISNGKLQIEIFRDGSSYKLK
jgi:cyanophycinase